MHEDVTDGDPRSVDIGCMCVGQYQYRWYMHLPMILSLTLLIYTFYKLISYKHEAICFMFKQVTSWSLMSCLSISYKQLMYHFFRTYL